MADGSTERRVFRVRAMQLEDVDQVSAVEGLCFPLPWPAETYRRDLRYQGSTHYLVVERLPQAETEPGEVVGFCGYWLISGEVHISTIGVHPDYRGFGLGEYLLVSLLSEGMESGADSATLEVRVSNHAAQKLYRKYGFEPNGRRRRYYRDNHEDALLMGIESLTGEDYRALLLGHWQELRRRFSQEVSRRAYADAEERSTSLGR